MKQRIVILGGGESGTGAALLAKQKGYDVFLSDSGELKEKYERQLKDTHIPYEKNGHHSDQILLANTIIKSPGIPDNAGIIQKVKAKKIPVISEIEFAGRFSTGKKICITGSNGKSTTASLIHHILIKAGKDAVLAGNIGRSYASAMLEKDYPYCVLELSSFQLDGLMNFKADIAVLLNITEDHLDRYNNSLEQYADSKFRIINNQTEEDTFIYCADDPMISKTLKKKEVKSTKYPFSIEQKITNGAFTEGESIQFNLINNSFNMSIHKLALQGKHNLYNSMAAGIAGRVLEIKKDLIRESLSDFQNIEHRLEFVAKIHGISFINDSKATNVNSTWYALESIQAPIIWIVGGVDKGNDYSSLFDLVSDKVKAIICLGKDNSKIHKAFNDKIEDIVDATTANHAVKLAYELGKNGDHVLLSPACASFDLFKDFEDRGHQFKAAVRSL